MATPTRTTTTTPLYYIPWPTSWTPAANCPNLTYVVYSTLSYYGTTSSAYLPVTRMSQDFYRDDGATLSDCTPPGYVPHGSLFQYYNASTPLQCPNGYTMNKSYQVDNLPLITTRNQCCPSGWSFTATSSFFSFTPVTVPFCFSNIPTSTTVPVIIDQASTDVLPTTTTVVGPTMARAKILVVAYVKPLPRPLSNKKKIYIAVGVVLGVIVLVLAWGYRMIRKRHRRRLRYDYLAARQARTRVAEASQSQTILPERLPDKVELDIPLQPIEKAVVKDRKEEELLPISPSNEQLVMAERPEFGRYPQSWSNYETMAITPIHVAAAQPPDHEPVYTETQTGAHDAITDTAPTTSDRTGQPRYETAAL